MRNMQQMQLQEPAVAQKQLIIEHMQFAKNCARKFIPRLPLPVRVVLDKDDLESIAYLGLVQAAQAYQQEKGGSFRTFAAYRIKGAIWDEVRRMHPVSHRTKLQIKVGYLDEPIKNDENPWDFGPDLNECTPLEQVVLLDEARTIRKAVQELRPIEREIIVLYFFEGCTIQDIVSRLHMPRSTVYYTINRAISNVKSLLIKSWDLPPEIERGRA